MDLVENFRKDVRNVKKKVYGTSLTSIASNNLIFSFFHLYAVDLGSTPLTQSIITSQTQLGNTILQPYFGSRSDEKGRRPYLMLGWGSLSVTFFLIMILQILGRMTVSVLLIFLLFQTILGSASIPVWTAYLGDITSKKTRGQILGKITAIGTIFSIIVILLVGKVMENIGGARIDQYIIPFGVAAILLLFSCIIVWRLPETLRNRSSNHKRPSIRKILNENPQFSRFTKYNALAMFAMSMTWPLYSFVYRDVVNITPTQLVIVSAAYTLMSAISQQLGGRIADKIGRKPGLILGRLSLSIYPLIIALSTSWSTILLAELFSGIGSGLAMMLTSVAILDLAKNETERGKLAATSNFIIGFVTFFGALFSGALAQILTVSLGNVAAIIFMLYMTAILRFIAALLFFRIPETLHHKGPRNTTI